MENRLVGNIKVASSKTISNYIMPNIYFDFLTKYKDVKLDILTINSSKILDLILKSKLDIGLIEVNFENSNIIKEKLSHF